MKKILTSSIVFLLAMGSLIAQSNILEISTLDRDKKYSFFPYLSIFTDTSAQKTLSEVHHSPQIQARFVTFDLKQVDLSAHAYWLKCKVNNLSGDSLRIGLHAGIFEQLDIYLLAGDSLSAFSQKPVIQRILKKRFSLDYLTLPRGSSTLYFHVSRKQDISLMTTIIGFEGMAFFHNDFSDFWIEKKDGINAFSLLYFGGFLLLFFYNLFLTISLRDKIYFFYLLTLFWMGLFLFGNKDLYAMWVAPAPPKYQIWLMWSILIPSVMSQFLFMRAFLDTKTWLSYIDKISKAFIGLGMVLIIAYLIPFFYPYIGRVTILYTFTANVLFCYTSVLALIKKRQNIRFYFLGTMAQAIGAIVYLLDESFRLIPTSIYSVNAVLIGSLMEMTLFSLALADRISGAKKALVEQQVRQAQEREKLIEEKNKELEIKVQERTLALQSSNEALQKSNQTKDKLFSIISHDLRSPMAALSSTLEILNLDMLTHQELAMIKKELQKQFSATDTTLQNLLLWARNQMQSEKTTPILLILKSIVNEKINLFEKVSREKKISLINLVSAEVQVFADENHLRTILRNLIANALKFTLPNGQIVIESSINGEMVQVSVKDTGVGMSAENKDKLFSDTHFSTQGTSGEKGSGLGLVLVKELVEKNGGKIWVESEIDKGSTFYFTLKNAKLDNEKMD